MLLDTDAFTCSESGQLSIKHFHAVFITLSRNLLSQSGASLCDKGVRFVSTYAKSNLL